MDLLERLKHASPEGVEYWLAREIHETLGYPTWREFEALMDRARDALRNNNIDPSHHFGPTHKMVSLGSGSQRQVEDYFLSRAACYLIAMNGDPAKHEIAAAQAYFVVQTRQHELEEERSEDEKRIELREKVTQSVKLVSGVAKSAGVRSQMQGVFHDQRFRGLYGMSLKDVKSLKGLGLKDQLLDRAGLLELSMHDFQMNLAADVIDKSQVKGEQAAIRTNLEVAQRVRRTVEKSGGTLPEQLPLEPPIKEVRKRVANRKKAAKDPSIGS
ncbi:MAG: DNA damage-inducible protein D [Rhodopseudomonas palustris]|uniref:DNA damage-inducible protein D n=1 Tax=Rhodopseudomonas palustris TaxID=1076 RepID=A0A933RWF3_RHOPL|nr:DNA damage-inducible protein D [Rhodopseudomonas palustris]